MVLNEYPARILWAAWDLLNGASAWLVASYVLAGVMHAVLSPERLQRMLGNASLGAVLRGTVSGMLLPICSCGVIPLGLGLYYSGAYLGPTLAFMAATPVLNPAALLLTYGFLGPQIASIYLVTGFFAAVAIGVIGNRWGGQELRVPGMDDGEAIALESQAVPLAEKLWAGLQWGFRDMGVMVSQYVCLGLLIVGAILVMVPPQWIQQYLGAPGLISLTGIAALGAVMYVCAVGHIPFIAVLIASGAAPGVAITFLMSGAATNVPELISIYRMIGKRAAVMYLTVLTVISFGAGYLTNLFLMPGFVPFFQLDRTREVVALGNALVFSAPEPVRYFCSGVIILLATYSVAPRLTRWWQSKGAA